MKALKGIDKKLDDICRELCKERADWTCEYSGLAFPDRKGGGIHWSHFYGRRARGTRWDMDNCAAHSHGSHSHLSANPAIFTDWQKEYLGEERYDLLTARFHKPMKFYKGDKEEMLTHYQDQLKALKDKRTDGIQGYIEIVNWF